MEQILSKAYACDTITKPDLFLDLEPEWDALRAELPDSRLSESFAWARLCWSYAPPRRAQELFCLAVRSAGRLVAVWPLVVHRQALWRVAEPLAASSEYCPFLVHPEADPDEVWSTVSTVLRQAGLDVLRLSNVRRDDVLGRCLARRLRPGAELYVTPTLWIDAADLENWDAYRARMSAKTRQTLNRRRRRFSRAAALVFEDLADPEERGAAWRWMLEHKRRWAKRLGLTTKWLFSDSFERFVAASLDVLGPSGARRLFVLKADGKLAAAELSSVDQVRCEAFMCAHDEAFAEFSPANLLHEDCIRWASEHGLAYDMRLGAGAHKASWATCKSEAASYCIPLRSSGKLLARCVRIASASANGGS